LNWIKVVEEECSLGIEQREKREDGRGVLTEAPYQREEGRALDGAEPSEHGCRRGESRRMGGITRDREERQRNGSLPRARAGEGFFKNRLWAHRTVYSACPVHTRQRTIAIW
jgi:hypothetical protein